MITKASAMHDVGKISITDTILLKPGRLTKEELEEISIRNDLAVDSAVAD